MKVKQNGIIALTRYEGLMRELAKAVAEDGASPGVFEKAAGMMAPWIPDRAVSCHVLALCRSSLRMV